MRHKDLIKLQQERERQEALEHRDVLLAINVILKSKEGLQLFDYLFKNFEVMCTPELGAKGEDLHEYLGFLRAGNSIYKLACEADAVTAASILAKLERKRYEDKYHEYRINNGYLNTEDDT